MRDSGRLGHLDLEALEIHVRSAVHGIGAVMLEELLNSDSGGYKGRTLSGEGGCLFEFNTDFRGTGFPEMTAQYRLVLCKKT